MYVTHPDIHASFFELPPTDLLFQSFELERHDV
jgi:hypothetical protein